MRTANTRCSTEAVNDLREKKRTRRPAMRQQFVAFGHGIVRTLSGRPERPPTFWPAGPLVTLRDAAVDGRQLIPSLRDQRDVASPKIDPLPFAIILVVQAKPGMSHWRQRRCVEADLERTRELKKAAREKRPKKWLRSLRLLSEFLLFDACICPQPIPGERTPAGIFYPVRLALKPVARRQDVNSSWAPEECWLN
jgi:hypothetical protein